LNEPLLVVDVVSTHFQPPPLCFWITTRTNVLQNPKLSATVTTPVTRLFGWNVKDTVRPCVAAPTVYVAPVAVPTAFVTVRGPVVAPDGTVVVIDVADTTVNVAVTPLNFTLVTPVKFDPVIVTAVPTGPMVGENEVITGGPTVKSAVLTTVLTGVVTEIFPVVAPVGTVAVICVPELTVNVVAFVALNFTTVAPQKLVPVIVTTVVPAVPVFGVNDVIVGAVAARTVKLSAAVFADVPVGFVTRTSPSPVAAPQGTVAVIDVSLPITNVAATPLIVTAVTGAVLKLVPVIVIDEPRRPDAGATAVTVGCAAHAGIAVMSTAVTPSTSANAVARGETFLGSLKEDSPFWDGGVMTTPRPSSPDTDRRFRFCAAASYHPTENRETRQRSDVRDVAEIPPSGDSACVMVSRCSASRRRRR
jgi:hypothetical protein